LAVLPLLAILGFVLYFLITWHGLP